LRILFFIDRPGVVRQFAPVLRELARRGHEVRVPLVEEPVDERLELVQRVAESAPGLQYDRAPKREGSDGWAGIAWVVRALGDVARYADPRYDAAPVLRRRAVEKTLDRLTSKPQLDPIAQRLVVQLAHRLAARSDAQLSRRVIRAAAALERAIPPSPRVTRYVEAQRPDVVLATSLMKTASTQVEYLKSARALGIPTGIAVASWDNLTNKGLLKLAPERVFVWNDIQRGEAEELHGIPRERVVATGAALFDPWFERSPTRTRAELAQAAGLDTSQPYVLFLGSSPFVTNHSDDEVGFVERLLAALRSSDDPRLQRLGVLVRPHPIGKGWRGADLSRFGNVAIWPERIKHPVAEETQAEFYDSIAHSAVVVGINTTAMIEAAVVGKSVLTVLAPEFAQESTLHFHYLLAENGGFLHVASSFEEHVRQLRDALDDAEADTERRREFVQSFVRPRGLDVSPTQVFADAIEELATLPVLQERGSDVLHGLLTLEARLASGRVPPPRRWLRSGARRLRTLLAP
jgi:hypothetical protein